MKTKEFSAKELNSVIQSKDSLKTFLSEEGILIIRNMIPESYLMDVRSYLSQVGASSLPNYHSISEACPNFHRMNFDDDRSYVRAIFHQFSFFPWNHDYFNLFKMFRPVFELRNTFCESPRDAFLGKKAESGCTARLSFQFYPKGGGKMNMHKDPLDHHQFTVPTVCMSKKGEDYNKGGAYFETKDERIHIDQLCNIGDVVLFHAQLPHGVEDIDSDAPMNWPLFQGRWVALAAVNKLESNTAIANAQDLEGSVK